MGSKGFGNPDPFHIKPKTHAEEEEMFEDEQRNSKLPGDVAEDNLVLGKPRSWKDKATPLKTTTPGVPNKKD